MRFLKTWAIVSIVGILFFIAGGYMLFDFQRRWFVATIAVCFFIAAVIRAFLSLSDRIDALEKRFNEKNNLNQSK